MSRRHAYELAMVAAVACVMPAAAQRVPDLNAPRRAAEKAADATNAHMSAETGQELKKSGAKVPSGMPSGPGASPAVGEPRAGTQVSTAPDALPAVTREIFAYNGEGRRDPFFSLILTEDLRPLLSDLKLVGILYAGAGGKSVAIMRDVQTNAQYRVNTGMTLGRMRVAQIKPRVVIFQIDEFGLNRQDSLFLADTSKTRFR